MNGAAEEEVLPSSGGVKTPLGFSPDGRFLLFLLAANGGADLWVKPMTGDGAPGPFLATPFREMWSAFSPDGRWVAYTSDESGRNEIYVRPFLVSGDPRQSGPKQATGGQWQVSAARRQYSRVAA